MRYETPRELLTRLKTGREESMQRLLTTADSCRAIPAMEYPQHAECRRRRVAGRAVRPRLR